MTAPLHRGPAEGQHVWFLADLMTVKATGDETGGSFALIEDIFPAGDVTPPHIHHTDHEAWYVLEGTVELTCGGKSFEAGPGGFVFAPKGVEHLLRVGREQDARLLVLTCPGDFAGFVVEMGTPAPRPELPPLSEPNVERLMQVASKYSIEITGPPPH